jgi:hypothetical protein
MADDASAAGDARLLACCDAASGRSEDESGEGARGGVENLQGTLTMMQGAPATDSC